MTSRQADAAAPDASLATTAATGGLSYPYGDRVPGPGEIMAISAGLGWLRLPLPGGLDHINCWVIGDIREGEADTPLTIIDTGMRLPGCRDAWDTLFAGSVSV